MCLHFNKIFFFGFNSLSNFNYFIVFTKRLSPRGFNFGGYFNFNVGLNVFNQTCSNSLRSGYKWELFFFVYLAVFKIVTIYVFFSVLAYQHILRVSTFCYMLHIGLMWLELYPPKSQPFPWLTSVLNFSPLRLLLCMRLADVSQELFIYFIYVYYTFIFPF